MRPTDTSPSTRLEDRLYLTAKRFHAYREELDFLRTAGKEKMARFLAEATGSGLGRPAFGPAAELDREYMTRIAELNTKLYRAVLIENDREKADQHKIHIGSTVTLLDMDEGELVHFTIVGPDDVDLQKDYISFRSRVGAALLGHSLQEIVRIELQKDRNLTYCVKAIEHLPLEPQVLESAISLYIRQLE